MNITSNQDYDNVKKSSEKGNQNPRKLVQGM